MPGIDESENEWRYRVKSPDLFRPDTFRRKDLGGGVAIVIGKLKNPPEGKEDSMVTQSYRFSKEKFKTKKDVQDWLKEHEITAAASEITDKMIESGWWDITASDISFTGSIGGKPAEHKFSKEDIETIAKTYNPDILEAPVKIEHTDEGPAHGWIDGLRTQFRNGRLYLQARLKELSDTLREALKKGRYRSRSAEIYLDFMGSGKPYLAGLAFLGATEPAVKTLNSLPSLAARAERADLCSGFVLCAGKGPPEDETFFPVSKIVESKSKEFSNMEAKDIKKAITEGWMEIKAALTGGKQEDSGRRG